MKIAILGAKAIPYMGGINAYVEQTGSRLVKRGHEVVVYCRRKYLRRHDRGPYRGMQRVLTPGLGTKHLDALTHTLTAALHVLRQDADIVHIHGSGQSVVSPILRLSRRQKVLVTIHAMDWCGTKWGPAARLCLRTAARVPVRFAHEITAVSRTLQSFYEEAFGRRPTFVPTGIEILEPLPPRRIREFGLQGNDYFFFAGRFVPEKGCHLLIDAYERLDTDKRLVIAGAATHDDPYGEQLLARASDRVLFVGHVSGELLQELFSNAYLFVQPSLLEGMPVAVLEALSYGRCVLASDIPGNVEALDGHGFTFQAGDVDELSAKLRSLLDSPDVVTAQRDSALEYVRRERTWDKTVDALESVYERALNGRRG